MSSALIIVDVQRDFLPGGALGVPDGHRVIRPLIAMGDSYMVDHVVLTRDWHPADHVSFSDEPQFKDRSWPAHCVQDTWGAEIDSEIMEAFPNAPIFSKGFQSDTEAYSGFYGRDLDRLDEDVSHLAYLLGALDVGHVYVGGLALDYCVAATVLDAYSAGFNATVLIDATRPVSYVTGALAVADMAHYSGIDFATVEQMLVA